MKDKINWTTQGTEKSCKYKKKSVCLHYKQKWSKSKNTLYSIP